MSAELDCKTLHDTAPDTGEPDPPTSSFRERELAYYFRAAHAARHGQDRESAVDDLVFIAMNTEWPALAERAANAIPA